MLVSVATLLLALVHPAYGAVIWKLPPTVAVKQVAASSTFGDKHDAYAAWHALSSARCRRWCFGSTVSRRAKVVLTGSRRLRCRCKSLGGCA
jgi:hypothetical protein